MDINIAIYGAFAIVAIAVILRRRVSVKVTKEGVSVQIGTPAPP